MHSEQRNAAARGAGWGKTPPRGCRGAASTSSARHLEAQIIVCRGVDTHVISMDRSGFVQSMWHLQSVLIGSHSPRIPGDVRTCISMARQMLGVHAYVVSFYLVGKGGYVFVNEMCLDICTIATLPTSTGVFLTSDDMARLILCPFANLGSSDSEHDARRCAVKLGTVYQHLLVRQVIALFRQ